MYLMERFLQAGRQMTVQRSTAMAAMEREEISMKTAWKNTLIIYFHNNNVFATFSRVY
jgi:hypothetical protein